MTKNSDLIDYLKIYKARTIPRPTVLPAYHYTPSTKALDELQRWPVRR